MKPVRTLCWLAGVAALAVAAPAQSPKLPEFLASVKASVTPAKLAAGGRGILTVTVDIAPGWHIWANKPGDENAIPTTFEVAGDKVLAFGKPTWSTPTTTSEGGKIHEGKLVIAIPVTIARASVKPAKLTLTGKLKAQGCNDRACMPPATVPVAATMTLGK